MAEVTATVSDEDAAASDAAPPHPRVNDATWSIILGVLIAGLAWSRMSPTTRSTVWAEDGATFLMEALRTDRPLGSLLIPYDGYLHFVPRLVIELITFFIPPEWYAVAISAASCIVVGILGGIVFITSRDVVAAFAPRVVLALLPALAPPTAREVIGNVANVHWFFLYTIPWLLMYRPRTRLGAAVLGVVALAASLTEIQGLFFAPLLLWRWRDRRTWLPKAGYALGMVAQAVALLTTTRAPKSGPVPAAADILGGYLVNAVMSSWIGSIEVVTTAVGRFGWRGCALLLIPAVAALVLVLRRGRPEQRLAVMVFALASPVLWVAAFVVNRPGYVYPRPDAAGEPPLVILRYSLVPATFLLAVLVLGAAALPRRWWAGLLTGAVAIPLTMVAVLNFVAADATRSGGPVWLAQIDQARQHCLTEAPTVEERLEVAPAGQGFVAPVPCALLQGER